MNAKYPNGFTNTSQLASFVAPLTSLDNGILRIGLTGQAATDARALVAADAAELADIATGNGAAFPHDNAAGNAADNALRADLGLPPAT